MNPSSKRRKRRPKHLQLQLPIHMALQIWPMWTRILARWTRWPTSSCKRRLRWWGAISTWHGRRLQGGLDQMGSLWTTVNLIWCLTWWHHRWWGWVCNLRSRIQSWCKGRWVAWEVECQHQLRQQARLQQLQVSQSRLIAAVAQLHHHQQLACLECQETWKKWWKTQWYKKC